MTANAFQSALDAFRERAAKHFKVDAKQIVLVPSTEAMAKTWVFTVGTRKLPSRVGNAFAFEADRRGASGSDGLRGWATADGAVMTHKENSGRFFEEMGVFTRGAKVDADELAHWLVWSISGGSAVADQAPPSLKIQPDGGGELKFYRGVSATGPTAFEYVYEDTYTFSADKRVVSKESENLNK